MKMMIVFRLGDERFALDIDKVLEVTETQIPVRVPKSPQFVLGLVNIRGNVIPVLSLKRRLGISGDETGSLLLIIEDNGRIAGIKVDELYGTKKINEKRIKRRKKLFSMEKKGEYFHGVYEGEKKPMFILNLEKILSKGDR